MPRPHGNKLINRYITKIPKDIEEIPKYEINNDLSEDILNIANGVFSPLKGFLCYNDLDNVVREKRLENDTPWTIPILLDFENKIVQVIDNYKEKGLSNSIISYHLFNIIINFIKNSVIEQKPVNWK